MASITEILERAVRHHQSGKLAQAEPLYRQALRINPNIAEANYNLGGILLEKGLVTEAEACYRQALRIKPNLADAHNNLGNILYKQGQYAGAAECYRQALRFDTNLPNTHYNLGNVLVWQGNLAEAAECFRQALAINPNHADAHNNLGNISVGQEQLAEAIKCFRQALAINPNHADAHSNLGNVLKEQGELTQAVACYREALRLNPRHADAQNNLGNALIGQGLLKEAAECYQQAIHFSPGNRLLRWNRCILRLLQGNFEGTWQDFEHRWAVPGMVLRSFQEPRWTGSSFQGKTIQVYAEQGLGDTLQFLRYLPKVQGRGGRVIFACPPALHDLLTNIKGVDTLVPAGAPLPRFDVQIPLLSLPGLFGTTLATIPAGIPYLRADPKLVQHWGREIAPAAPPKVSSNSRERGDIFKIGITWQASPKHPGYQHKSVSLKCFGPVAQMRGIKLFSLQVGPGTKEMTSVSFPVTDLGSRFDPNSFSDMAEALMNLDLVVTVDTAVVHLAGALGLPVWVALPFVSCWRWLRDREDSPWYPTVHLFRQSRPGNWEDVFEKIALELRALFL